MRTLTETERSALCEVGDEGEAIADHVFRDLEQLGWGTWVEQSDDDGIWSEWTVTPAGKRALDLDTLARSGDRPVGAW